MEGFQTCEGLFFNIFCGSVRRALHDHCYNIELSLCMKPIYLQPVSVIARSINLSDGVGDVDGIHSLIFILVFLQLFAA